MRKNIVFIVALFCMYCLFPSPIASSIPKVQSKSETPKTEDPPADNPVETPEYEFIGQGWGSYHKSQHFHWVVARGFKSGQVYVAFDIKMNEKDVRLIRAINTGREPWGAISVNEPGSMYDIVIPHILHCEPEDKNAQNCDYKLLVITIAEEFSKMDFFSEISAIVPENKAQQ